MIAVAVALKKIATPVAGSRISIQGYEAPSPVTTIGLEQVNRDAPMNIVESITKLPSVGVSETPNNGNVTGDLSKGDAARSVVNLRNLGIARTLVLFDGQPLSTTSQMCPSRTTHPIQSMTFSVALVAWAFASQTREQSPT
jgi:outer membrane receptor for ferrienterochelin and colicin